MLACLIASMRIILAVVGLVSLNCGVPDSDPCARASCQAGWHCSAPGGVVQCDPDNVAGQGGGLGGGSGGGTGSGAGGGTSAGGGSGGGGGGVVQPPSNLFVTVKYVWASCCQDTRHDCRCAECVLYECVLTQKMAPGDFAASRLGVYSSCAVVQTGTDSWSVDCGGCTLKSRVCRVNQVDYADAQSTCSGPRFSAKVCSWFQ